MDWLFNTTVTSRDLILDVGANVGKDGLGLAISNPHLHVIAFEPVKQMHEVIGINFHNLQQKIGHAIPNYTLVPTAVSNFDGTAIFNVAGQLDWGCSSFREFSDNLDKTWPGRDDFVVTERIEVPVIRLDSFFKTIPFSTIAYLHTDCQGSDLEVLHGLGTYRQCVVRGSLECATGRAGALYKNQHLLQDVCLDFTRWGYEIEKLESNDDQLNEVNVIYTNKFPRAAESL